MCWVGVGVGTVHGVVHGVVRVVRWWYGTCVGAVRVVRDSGRTCLRRHTHTFPWIRRRVQEGPRSGTDVRNTDSPQDDGGSGTTVGPFPHSSTPSSDPPVLQRPRGRGRPV